MDEKKAGQIAVSGLVFALLGFVMSVALGVYVLYYQKDDSGGDDTNKVKTSMYAHHYQAPRMQQYMAPPPAPRAPAMSPPPAQTFQPPALTQPPAGPSQAYHLAAATYASAPPIPATVPSGAVGTFFD